MPLPAHLLLPGLVTVRRSRAELQVGLTPRHAVRLDDDDAARCTLDLTAGTLREAPDPPVVEALAAQGLLVPPEALGLVLPGRSGAAGRPARDRAHSVLRHGRRAVEARERRRATYVVVRTHGDDVAHDTAVRLVALLADSEVAAVLPHRDDPPTGWAPSVVVVVAGGETPREEVDDLLRDRVPHLHLRLVEGEVVVGPFVMPGVTACLRCLDLHRATADPAWPLVVRQAAAASARPRPDGVPAPVDATALALGLGWAARDVVLAAEGLRPGTWSSTARVGVSDPAPEHTSWWRHPACACSCWDPPGSAVVGEAGVGRAD